MNERERALAEELLKDLPGGVAIYEEWIQLPESQARVDAKYGPDYTVEQAISVMLRKRRVQINTRSVSGGSRSYKPPKDEEPEPVRIQIDPEEFKRLQQEKVNRYLTHYDKIAPNDLSVIQDLASVEVEQEKLHELQRETIISGDVVGAGRVAYSLKLMSDQARALQRHLHIDRLSREREAERQTEADKVLGVIDEAGAWVEQHGFLLDHLGCQPKGVIGKSDIRFGVLLWDFREIPFTLTWTCPRCGETVTFTHTPSEEDLKAIEPEWVNWEEEDYQVKEQALRGAQEEEEDEEDDG